MQQLSTSPPFLSVLTSYQNQTGAKYSVPPFLSKRLERWIELSDQHESVFFCARISLCIESTIHLLSQSITGSSDQFLLMLFCCHGFQVLQCAPEYCLCRTALSVFSLPSPAKTAATSGGCHRSPIQTEFTEAERSV